MAIDLPTMAKALYGNTCPSTPSSVTSQYMTGWGYPYQDWPQSLKDEYAYNPTAAKKLLADAGYPTIHTDVVVQAGSDLDALQSVQTYFAAIGVTMDITQMDATPWNVFVFVGHKQDALAMRNKGILGLGFEPTSHLIWYTTGPADYAMVNDPTYNALTPKMTSAASIDTVKQVIHDANVEATQQHFSISLLQPNIFSLSQPWLKGYNGQYAANSGSPGGAHLNGFYMARFWIDKSLEK
jgi:ABC-type transport system substrate-binding protein